MIELSEPELDAAVAEAIFGVPVGRIPKSEDNGDGYLRDDTATWRDIVERAIAAGLELRQGHAYKGVSYGGDFDGWSIYFHLDYSDAYKAPDTISLTGPLDKWQGQLSVCPALPPRYSSHIDAAWQVVERLRGERDMVLKLVGAERMVNMYTAAFWVPHCRRCRHARWARCAGACNIAVERTAPLAICLAALRAVAVAGQREEAKSGG